MKWGRAGLINYIYLLIKVKNKSYENKRMV